MSFILSLAKDGMPFENLICQSLTVLLLHAFTLIPIHRYGYNGQESRDNIFVLQSEELVYYVASVVVVYDVYRHKQRYYTEHTMKITWYIAMT